MLPTLDSFLDLGNDVHDLVKHLYVNTKRAETGAINKIVDSSSSQTINTVCVPGAGFSGFWYSIGRLHAMKANKAIRQYRCFSAGCLGAVVNVLNHTIDDLLGKALEAQQLFFSGSIDRFEVVEFFVDAILKPNKDEFELTNYTDNSKGVEWIEELKKIHILTTGSNGKYHSRQAENFIELKTLLMQTTWIPYVTGRSMWRGNHENFDDLLHMDGAFTMHVHPRCDGVKLGLPLNWNLWRSILSPSLDKDKALEFYKYGISMYK